MMLQVRLGAAVILGFVVPQIFSISMSSPPPDCAASVDICMSDLCKSEQAFYAGTCGAKGCRIKASEVCNMTVQTALAQLPALRGCACAWEEELCDSIEALATQCLQQPAAAQQRLSTGMDWKASSLIGYVHEGAGSCLDRMAVCVSDAVCNRYLVPVLQACSAQHCDLHRCREVTQHFYGSMPHNVAEMLVMCECETSDQSCLQMKTALHSGTCRHEAWTCLDTVNQCVEDRNCRDLLKTFQAKCWSSEEAQCSDSDPPSDECLVQMDPALIHGEDSECRAAFLTTVGSALHYPCSCDGVYNTDLLTCEMIHDVLHNRSHFSTFWKSGKGLSKPLEVNGSVQRRTWSHEYLLYAFTIVLLVGVVVLMPLAVVRKIRMMRGREKTKYHHSEKSNRVAIL